MPGIKYIVNSGPMSGGFYFILYTQILYTIFTVSPKSIRFAPMKLLENKVALITGASRGIGRGIAEKFAEHGCNIVFSFASSVDKARAFEAELQDKYGIKAKGYQSDAAVLTQAE